MRATTLAHLPDVMERKLRPRGNKGFVLSDTARANEQCLPVLSQDNINNKMRAFAYWGEIGGGCFGLEGTVPETPPPPPPAGEPGLIFLPR